MTTNTQTPSTQSPRAVLVIGANGKTGRRVAQRLQAAGLPVKAASRSSETPFDWQDNSTWAPALEGVQSAYITFYPDLAFPGAADLVEGFARVALDHGVKRLVLLSGRGEEGARDAEQRIQNSGADWTIVRCSVFNQNFSESFAEAIAHGHLAMPVGQTKEPFVDAEDIADVAFAALTDNRHIGQVYELTGPRLLTLEQVASELSEAIGRTIEFHSVSVSQYAEELTQHGFSSEEALPIAQLISEVFDGRNAYLTDGVQRALGRAPRDFSDFANAAAADGIWNPKEVLS
ncbi:NAD(P)H-binding protein [Pelagicoccus sp. NFK12]|uniref:NAD(P)H-binding protein n=1 Tax=Pelagicoccus enzymogenes TaxID=2773457 RepID=A0A927FBH6_9BACT|nr:NAD(P)H-binding protein [Pelagicoccus enzymogenes]MBD5782042.1 NAD(P)H-binding protein [Pelagicoccus enzymogenes]